MKAAICARVSTRDKGVRTTKTSCVRCEPSLSGWATLYIINSAHQARVLA